MASSYSGNNGHSEHTEMCFLMRVRAKCSSWVSDHRGLLTRLLIVLLSILYLIYYVAAMIHSIDGATLLTVCTSVAVFLIVCIWFAQSDARLALIKRFTVEPCKRLIETRGRALKWFTVATLLVTCVAYLTLVVINSYRQVRALAGALILLLTSITVSKNLRAVQWNYVLVCLVIQFVTMILLTRTVVGYDVFYYMTYYVLKYVLYCVNGGSAVYGLFVHPLFMILTSVSTFVGATLALLYSLLRPVDLVFKMKRGVASITDFQVHLTLATLHSLVTGVTVSPLCLAGVNARHLVTAMWTCAPAAAAMTLITYPNIKSKSIYRPTAQLQATTTARKKLPKFGFVDCIPHVILLHFLCMFHNHIGHLRGHCHSVCRIIRNYSSKRTHVIDNVFMRVSRGAFNGLIVALLCLMVAIALVSIYSFGDATVAWLGSRVGLEITINSVLGYLFTPVAYMIGVEWSDCYQFGCFQADKVFGFMVRALLAVPRLESDGFITSETATLSIISLCGLGSWATFSLLMAICWTVAPRHSRRYVNMWVRLSFNVHMACLYSTSVAALICPESFYGRK